MRFTVYGIKQCDTMKKTFSWLDQQGVSYTFHDYKKAGIDNATLARWCARVGWQALVNTRGTTWRKLSPEQQRIDSEADAIALMAAHTSLIRRPVIESDRDRDTERGGGTLSVGFDPERLGAFVAAQAGTSKGTQP